MKNLCQIFVSGLRNSTADILRGWFYQNAGILLSDEGGAQIWSGYFAAAGETQGDTISFLPP